MLTSRRHEGAAPSEWKEIAVTGAMLLENQLTCGVEYRRREMLHGLRVLEHSVLDAFFVRGAQRGTPVPGHASGLRFNHRASQ